MGNETSIPGENGGRHEAHLDEQARAPPSSTTPAPTLPTTGRSSRKLMGVFRGGNQQNNHPDNNNYDSEAAAYGHQNGSANGAAQLPQQAHYPQDHSAAAASSPPSSAEKPMVGVMFEKPNKKSLFHGRSNGRGAAIINSMRNLSLGNALRKKEVTDWERQWDDDEDDDEDDEEEDDDEEQSEEYMARGSTGPLHQIRPGMDVGHSSVSGPSDTPDMLAAQQLASPSASMPPNFVTPEVSHRSSRLVEEDEDDDGALEWDTGGSPEVEDDNERPNVKMFTALRVLGKGSFGKVVLVQKNGGRTRGQLYAMKILKKTHLVKRRQIERTRTERQVLSVVNHPFIMKLHYAFQNEFKLYLVLDYCPGGELFFHLSRFRRFPERVARFYAAELLLAIGHLHKRGIIYRDLKPENVLLDADGHVKLGDFGLARAGIQHPTEGASSMCGTPEYMAPEVLAQQGHGFCVDYWGLGMIVYEMMTGLPPWYTTDRTKLFRRLKSAPLDIPSYFSTSSATCVGALLERNPRRRLGVSGIRAAMEHDFFRNISWRALYGRRVEAPIKPCEGWKAPDATLDEDPSSPWDRDPSSIADIEKMDSQDLEAATANFDNSFTRMPIESEDVIQPEDAEAAEQLNENTFRGFSFDSKDGSSAQVVAAVAAAHGTSRMPLRQAPSAPHTLD